MRPSQKKEAAGPDRHLFTVETPAVYALQARAMALLPTTVNQPNNNPVEP
jgi:hypothetical protein